MQPGDMVLRFIASIGGPREAQFYLSLFRSQFPESFAIIAVSNEILRQAPGALAVDLRFLARLGLTPVVMLGLLDGQHDNDDGERSAANRGDFAVRAHADAIARRLREDISCAIIHAPHNDDQRDGPSSSGDSAEAPSPDATPTTTMAAKVRAAARNGALPIVVSGNWPSGNRTSALKQRFATLTALAGTLRTRKIVVLGRQSGLQPMDGAIPSLVDITYEHDELAARLPRSKAALLSAIRDLIEDVPHRLTVSVTSPLDLLRELFTTYGAGTLLRRGSRIQRHHDYRDLNCERIRFLLESAFERPLVRSFFEQPVERLYIADNVRGLAIITDSPLGPYLSKFAVEREAQGEGVGGDLWRALAADCPSLLWRSRAGNPINRWYQHRCHGMMRTGDWHVFWRGLPVEHIADAVNYALAQPADFPPMRVDAT